MKRTFPKGDGHKRRGELARRAGHRELSTSGPAKSSQGLGRLRSELDRLFDRFFGAGWGILGPKGGVPSALLAPGATWMPSVEVSESDREFTVRAELPGLDAKDIDVSVSGNRLVLSGEKKEEREEEKKGIYHSERSYGSFRRTIPLPGGADPERITAEYDRGVLVVHVGKSEVGKQKRIEISPPQNR